MVSMQSWSPARGSGMVVLRALPVIVCSLFQAQWALSYESSLTFLPPGSTLDAHVPPEDFDLQETVLGIVEAGILRKSQTPTFQAPKNAAQAPKNAAKASKAVASPKTKVAGGSEGPVLSLTPLQESAAKSKPSTEDVAMKASPFRKWVKPNSSDTESDIDLEQPAPKVARRTPARAPQPLPLPTKKSSTAVASDLSKRADEPEQPVAEEKSVSPPVPAEDKAAPPAVVKNLPPLTRSQINLRTKIRNVLTHYYNRPLNTRDRSPWELMHAMLAFEAHSKVLQGGPNGDPITAVGWLCYNRACKRRTLMYVSDEGELRVRVGPALQGHRGQLLAMLAQSRINENYPLLVEGHELKITDLIEMEKRTCYPRTELTFKLIGLMHYLDSDEKWLNDQGMQWDIPKMVSEELRQPVRGAACGGTHRLSGLTLAYKTRIARDEPVDGQYLKAQRFVNRYQQYAYRLQNRDGSFSTEWFRGPGNENDIDRKLKTTGHILEWLLYAATEKELKHWKTTKAANYLANIMYRNRYRDWEAGPLGHAIHALLVYDRLVFSPYDPPEVLPMATQPKSQGRRR